MFCKQTEEIFFTILNLYFILQMKTYGSDFFDDKIDCQCQEKKENTNSIANLFENPDSIIVTAATIDCGHFWSMQFLVTDYSSKGRFHISTLTIIQRYVKAIIILRKKYRIRIYQINTSFIKSRNSWRFILVKFGIYEGWFR